MEMVGTIVLGLGNEMGLERQAIKEGGMSTIADSMLMIEDKSRSLFADRLSATCNHHMLVISPTSII